jgi:hypothetical protein
MKQSKMVDKIHELLEIQSNQGTSYRYKALEILKMIESNGMLPPEREVLVKASDRPPVDGVTLLDYIGYQNTWESE